MKILDSMKHSGIFLLSVAAAILALLHSENVSAQRIAVKANAAMYAAMTPNLSFELVTGEMTSADFTFFGHVNPYGYDSRVIGIQPQFKYWIAGRPLVREYVGILALAASYDTTWKDVTYEGNAVAAGVTAGYVLPMGKRWNVEFSGGVGAMAYHHRSYDKDIDPQRLKTLGANAVAWRVIPVNLGITFIYIIK